MSDINSNMERAKTPKTPTCTQCNARGQNFQSGRSDSGELIHRCMTCGHFFSQEIEGRIGSVPGIRHRADGVPFQE